MSIYSLDQPALQSLADCFARYRPNVGKTVKVTKGRKYRGKVGTITWHGRDNYVNAYRYGDSATHFATDCMGRYGYRVRVQPDEGAAFFVPADYVMTCEQ